MKELEVAERAAVEAGKIAMKYFRGDFEVKLKGRNDLVTNADVECERHIKKIISSEYPLHSFLGEEEGSQGTSKDVWVIDPIDGTTNFVHGVEQFCHSIALVRDNELVCGAVYNPVMNLLYTAYRGKGAFLNGRRIKVSRAESLGECLIITGFPYDAVGAEESDVHAKTLAAIASLRGSIHDVRRFGSAALDLCRVAHGICDAYFEYRIKPWDIAAGMLIVKEAGGKVTDINGNEASFMSPHFVASNGLVHERLLSHLEASK